MRDGLIFPLDRYAEEDFTPLDALVEALEAADSAAQQLVEDAFEAAQDAAGENGFGSEAEPAAPEWCAPLLPDGRPLVALRMARDPDSGRFTLHLVAGPEGAAG